ncbi:S-methyl-5'-thioadenosine phosphorylase [Leptospirillum ferriphilum]|uniref:S-methyl-5'-thioadenosine phosphorylase n=1 Tax=Leptospirillum ferriphilum (strain ML-04) TaxID=1048260 RepID=J9ZA93_LEPFM|nr:S-methyl-5'-thioadenosine phosphorylase [Leptospirillum ferriphilum]AFS53389.1 purine nucleoside phosphorylase [Leptospirillum ferriphilum ML-04]
MQKSRTKRGEGNPGSGPVGIIGGSGLYQMEGLTIEEERVVETPWGVSSDPYLIGKVGTLPVVFLSRHGKGHRYLPSEINYRANLAGLKSLGVSRVLSVSAVGSLKEEIAPGDMVLVDDFIDLTRQRPMSFYGNGAVGHTPYGRPVCSDLFEAFSGACEHLGLPTHRGGTYICMEGPAFSTRAESRLYRQWGADVIGMTNGTEARLAREIGLCYATLALATDYDCWHPDHDMVTVADVIRIMNQNVRRANTILLDALERIPSVRKCHCADAPKSALITDPARIPQKTREKLSFLGLEPNPS